MRASNLFQISRTVKDKTIAPTIFNHKMAKNQGTTKINSRSKSREGTMMSDISTGDNTTTTTNAFTEPAMELFS